MSPFEGVTNLARERWELFKIVSCFESEIPTLIFRRSIHPYYQWAANGEIVLKPNIGFKCVRTFFEHIDPKKRTDFTSAINVIQRYIYLGMRDHSVRGGEWFLSIEDGLRRQILNSLSVEELWIKRFDAFSIILQAYPDEYSEILWEEMRLQFDMVVQKTIIPFLRVINFQDVLKYCDEGMFLRKLLSFLVLQLQHYAFLEHIICEIIDTNHKPDVLKEIHHEIAKARMFLGLQSLYKLPEVPNQVNESCLNDIVQTAQHASKMVNASLGIVLGSYFYENRRDDTLKAVMDVWRPVEPSHPSSMESIAMAYASSNHSTIKTVPTHTSLEINTLIGFVLARRKFYVLAKNMLRDILSQIEAIYLSTSWEYGIAVAEFVKCCNMTREEFTGVLQARDALSKRVGLDDRFDTRYLQLALSDSLLADSSYEETVEVLEHLLTTETNNASVVLKATIRLSKAQRRMGEIFPSPKITAVLSHGIKVLDRVDGDLLSVFVEETMCNVSRVDTSEAPQSLEDMMVGYSTVRAAVLRIQDRIQEIVQNNLPKSGDLALSKDALDSITDSLERLETYLQRAVSNRQEVDDDNIRSMAEVFQKILGISLSENRSDTSQSSAEVQNITNSAFGGEVESSSPRNNVLILDGGGVRSLSSLVILEKLMQFINESVWKQSGRSSVPLEPYQVFDLVAGSGTGGMIAIMLGKLGMSLDQCCTTFTEFVEDILSEPILRGPAIAGLKWTRYRSAELQEWTRATLQKVCGNPDLLMSENLERATTDCTVVYKVHINKPGRSDFEPEPGYICSGPCPTSGSLLVRDALQATLASPNMFPAQKIEGRLYTDGGMEFNNPSYAIFDHCNENSRIELPSAVELPAIHHRNIGSSRVRFVNLGSGTKLRASIPQSSLSIFEKISRFSFRLAASKNNLSMTSKFSENTARHVESISRVSQNMDSLRNLKYERFSENVGGVFSVKTDRYKEIRTIETMTLKYVDNPTIREKLQRVGEEIARDYLRKQQSKTSVHIQ